MRCINSRQIIFATLVSEALLLGLGLCVSPFVTTTGKWNITIHAITLGIVLTLPPLLTNVLLWRYSHSHTSSVFNRFSTEVIVPLCQAMTITTAFIVAVLSGICEEFFFRGALNNLIQTHTNQVLACITTSIIFAVIHFIGNIKRYGAMIPLYVAMGGYLWLVHYLTESIACVAVTHGVYNFTVIMLTKRHYKKRAPL